MTPSSNETLERIARRIPIPEPAYERMLRRRDLKRRNQRITAGVVGIAVFVAAIWIVTSVSSLDQSQTSVVPGDDVTGPAVTGPTETGPAETGPTVAPDTGSKQNSYRIPPEGAALSTPVEGELIAEAWAGFTAQVQVYADGRVLSANRNGGKIVERRLSPEGVELVRQVVGERVHLGYVGSGAGRLASLFLGYPGLYSEMAQSAWEDREGKPYVPARYWACFTRTNLPLEAVLDLLPASAQALLRGSDPAWNPRCFVVTPEEARSLEAILSEAGSFNGDPWPWTVGAWSLRDGKGGFTGINLRPVFPDGRRFFRVPY